VTDQTKMKCGDASSRKIELRIHDASLALWQDHADDPTFREAVYRGAIRLLRSRGWSVAEDRKTARNYPALRHDTHFCAKGRLRADLQISGRVVKLDVWTETWVKTNSNGHRYDFDKRQKMQFLDRLRVDLEFAKLAAWASARWTVAVVDLNKVERPAIGGMTALAYIEQQWRKSGHCDRALGRTVPSCDRNRTSFDGELIDNGQRVWFRDAKGRLLRGFAYFSLNDRFTIVTSRYAVAGAGAREIHTRLPANPRARDNRRLREKRLECELARAVGLMDFARAETLRRIRFGDAELFLIFHRNHGAYYGPRYGGYTVDRVSAGKYTRDEALAEVARVPHLLEAHTLAGSRLAPHSTTKAA